MFLRKKKTFHLAGRLKEKLPRDRRIMLLAIFLFLFWGLILGKLFELQVLHYKIYAALASGQHDIYQKLFPQRGKIFVQDFLTAKSGATGPAAGLYPIVTNKGYNLVYAIPYEIENASTTTDQLVKILELEEDSNIFARLNKKDDVYAPVKHKVNDEKVAKIKELKLKGIYFTQETFRYYPEEDFAGQVLGFVGFSGDQLTGRYGLEEYFNEELTGQAGNLLSEKDPAGRLITIGKHLLEEAHNGSDLILTVDHTVQFVACQKLKKAVERHGADSGSLIIMEPNTGAIIGMCNFPTYNPNEYEKVEDINIFNNNAIYDAYEPGSIFKPITVAAALDANKITPESTYNDEGPLKIDRYTIRNSDDKYHGVQNMIDVLDKSLNTGAIYVVQQVGGEVFTKYVNDFGFGSLTGIELSGERAGDVSSLKKKSEIYYATASYGQGITATPLQMVTAFSAIANGGKLVKPYIVEEIVKTDGQSVKTQPQVVRQVISSRTSSLLKGMLVSVVNGVHGKRAGVPGYRVAGKTGTAQIARKDSVGYESNATIGSFVGFAPVDNPRFVMIVRIVRPRDVQFAESTAAPIFGDIAKFLLNYYQVPPDNVGG